jgi:hypothetical protein
MLQGYPILKQQWACCIPVSLASSVSCDSSICCDYSNNSRRTKAIASVAATVYGMRSCLCFIELLMTFSQREQAESR